MQLIFLALARDELAEAKRFYNRIPDHVRTFASEINWRQYVGAHNRLIHSYWEINNNIVWGITQNEIPVLIEQLHALKKAADENQTR